MNMTTVCKTDCCAGCKACIEVCPRNAISILDNIKSYNAVINTNLCVNCNLCHKVCPVNHPPHFETPKEWYQGCTDDEDLRATCSSGGFATSLAKEFILQGGVVCACCFKDGKFIFRIAESVDQINVFKGSKYVKSDPMEAYGAIAQQLRIGKKVLFIGLPCQVAGIKNVTPSDNLYTIDLICHGTPSPKLLTNFLSEYKISLEQIKEISFRKSTNFCLSQGQRGIEPEGVTDCYTYAFLNALDYTENCYECQYAKFERCSDITLGDSWGTDLSEEEQGEGISLLLCNTDKGFELMSLINSYLQKVDIRKAVQSNRQLNKPSMIPRERERFFAVFRKRNSFKKAIKKCYPKFYFKQEIKKALILLHVHRGGVNNYYIYTNM